MPNASTSRLIFARCACASRLRKNSATAGCAWRACRSRGIRRFLHRRFQVLQLVAEFQPRLTITRHAAGSRGYPSCAARFRGGAPCATAVIPSFFQKNPQLLWPRLDYARNHALFDDGVAARAQAGAQKDVGNVFAPHMLVVDVKDRILARCDRVPVLTAISAYCDHCPAALPRLLSKISSTLARSTGLRCRSR